MEPVKGVVLKAVGANARFEALASALELPKLSFGFEGDQ